MTLPMLGPVGLFVLVIVAPASSRRSTPCAFLTEGGPAHASELLLYTLYVESFDFLRTGTAAMAVVFLAIVTALTLLQGEASRSTDALPMRPARLSWAPRRPSCNAAGHVPVHARFPSPGCSAFRSSRPARSPATLALLPSSWSFANYSRALSESSIPRFLLNGVVVCGSIPALQVLICAPAAYALANCASRGGTASSPSS